MKKLNNYIDRKEKELLNFQEEAKRQNILENIKKENFIENFKHSANKIKSNLFKIAHNSDIHIDLIKETLNEEPFQLKFELEIMIQYHKMVYYIDITSNYDKSSDGIFINFEDHNGVKAKEIFKEYENINDIDFEDLLVSFLEEIEEN
ncbi:hypothetical protein [Flavobacterium rhizosphaerae]|uniref:Uncharacterized protein n=1 Tax=Flavobacterium rhizosphaerae TaxID=3163298 RepID=A0ABW8Z2A0_9FLAO